MIPFPANLRTLNVVRLTDGRYQASLQTADMESNAYRVAIAATVDQAVRELCGGGLPPPPY